MLPISRWTTMKEKKQDKKLNRHDIIEAVARLIAEDGLETLTMRNIAKHVGCSVGTLPHYFEGKDDIVIAALNWSHERIFNRLDAMTDAAEIHLQNLYPLLSASMPTNDVADIEWRVRLCLWDYATTDPEMRLSVAAVARYADELLQSLIIQLQEQGEVRADICPSTTALTFYQMCIGAGFNMLHHPMEKRERDLAPLHEYIEMIKTPELES